MQVKRLLYNKFLMNFPEKGHPSTFRSPSASISISVPLSSPKILKIWRENKILCFMKSQIYFITLKRFFLYNFFFSVCDSFISVKTKQK